MSYFDYPIDSSLLIQKKKKIKKEQKEKKCSVHKRIAILGGSTTNEIADQLELFLRNYDIEAEFYQSDYGKYWEDAVFGSEELLAFNPDLIFIHTNWRNITQFPNISNSNEIIESKLRDEYSRLLEMWRALKERFGCPIIQNNFERPNYRLLGNMDIWDCRGRSNYIFALNNKIYEYARNTENFYINDIDFLASNYGLNEWNDPNSWYMYKYSLNIKAIPFLADSVAKIIKAIYGKNKKTLILDLDNTLWGGVIGDEGVENIKLGPELPTGQVYYDFQKYCKSLKELGVILAINSKNDESVAITGLNHPYSQLHVDDFVAIKANWNPKSDNIIDLSSELSLGLDSFVFIDDNPAEREIVFQNCTNVSIPPVQYPEDSIIYIDRNGYFEPISISEEDTNKTELYKARADAQREILSFKNYDTYLDSLKMKTIISSFNSRNIQRVSQLTNKSNQFNLTTLRCSENDIFRMSNDSGWITISAKLVDKFADNGIVSVIFGEIIEDALHIRLWLMSCRVLKRTLEHTLMDYIIEKAREKNIKSIVGYYFPTAKNGMVKNFYHEMGFSIVNEDEEGNSTWKILTLEYETKNTHIAVEEE